MNRGEIPDMSQTDGERYRLLMEGLTDYAVCMLDRNGIVTSWNRGARGLKGYEPWEIIGQHFSCFYTPEDREAGLPEKALAAAAGEGSFASEGWRVRKDATRFWADVVIAPIRDGAGELIGYGSIMRDLAERNAAEDALEQSEKQFRLLVQSVTDYAIYMLDAEGRVVSWNAGAQRIKGHLPEEIIGHHFSRFYLDEDRERGEPQRGLRIAAEVGRFENEAWRIRKDGTRFWANVVIDAIRSEDGELIGFAKVTRDITERKEAQRALEEAREALFQAQKVEAIGQLTGGIAHDFNNLLMVILSSLDLMRKRLPGDDERLAALMDNASQAAQRGASLTQRMLAFARRQELDRKAVDLPGLVRGMTDLLQRSLGPSIHIRSDFPPALPKVYTDANQLEAALLNLAVNARDAMPAGGSLIISAKEEAVAAGNRMNLAPGHYVCFCVQDEGEGMDEETLARATDPFFTTKGIGKGTGLGLSMVHGFAEQSGGHLAIRSAKGVGTTVEVWLPAVEASGEAREDAPPAAPGSRASEGLLVLAVDDDVLVLMNTAAMLEDLGHTVLEALSGEEALSILARNDKIDLVVTDHAMPRMNGAELARAIKAERPDLPILLATGYAELPSEPGIDLPRLSKPFNQQDLARAVDEALHSRV